MAVVVSLIVILLVAAAVGRTCSRARPGHRAVAGAGHRHVQLPDVGVRTHHSSGSGGD